jgi:hypothetical protein
MVRHPSEQINRTIHLLIACLHHSQLHIIKLTFPDNLLQYARANGSGPAVFSTKARYVDPIGHLVESARPGRCSRWKTTDREAGLRPARIRAVATGVRASARPRHVPPPGIAGGENSRLLSVRTSAACRSSKSDVAAMAALPVAASVRPNSTAELMSSPPGPHASAPDRSEVRSW